MLNIVETTDINELICLARSDSAEARIAREQLFSLHELLLRNLVNRAARSMGIQISNDLMEVDPRYEDLQQVARLALFEAIQSFDPSRGVKLSTYLWKFVSGRLLDYMKLEIKYTNSLFTPSSDYSGCEPDGEGENDDEGDVYGCAYLPSNNDTFDEVVARQLQARVEEYISTLNPRQRTVVHQIFWQGRSQTEVACYQRVSTSMVHKILKQVEKGGSRYFGVNPYN